MHKIRKLVHVSSSAIYGTPADHPITESTEPEPIEAYGRSKLEGERIIREYIRNGGKAVSLRPRTLLGGSSRLGIFQVLFEWISEGRDIYIIGKGENHLQFLHMHDLLDVIFRAAYSESSGFYNVGAERFGTLKHDLNELIRHAGTSSRIRTLPVSLSIITLWAADKIGISPLAPWHYLTYHKDFVFNIDRTKSELEWTPEYDNVKALTESYDWYMQNPVSVLESDSSAHRNPVKQRILRILKALP